MLESPGCSIELENVFGPVVASSCLNGFDFTLFFEETILTLLPLGLTLLAASIRIWGLQGASEKVSRSWLYTAKGLTWLLYAACHVILLAFWSRQETPRTVATLPTQFATIGTSLVLLYLSHLSHLCSLRPSTVLNGFLFFTLLLDLPRLRTLYHISGSQYVMPLFAISWIVKSIVLVLEATEKRALVKKPYEDSPIESTSGILNRVVFGWLNNLLWRGSKTHFTVDTLPALDNDIIAASDPTGFIEKWDKANKYNKNALFWTMMFHYKWTFFEGVIPRLGLTFFNFAQPLLVERVLNFMGEPDHVNSSNYAYGLIAAYALVYIGIGICGNFYEHKMDRTITMFRGSLVSLIFQKTLRMSSSTISDSAAITLMSTDIERISNCLRDIHELYCCFIEVSLAFWLLARLLNVAMITSTVFTISCMVGGLPVAVAIGTANEVWLEAVQKRVAVTSRVLSTMKNVKMTGLVEIISNNLRGLRSKEISHSLRYRLYNVLSTLLFWSAMIISPMLCFSTYVLLARANDSATLTTGLAFSALTLFALMIGPLDATIHGSEELMTVLSCFQRIQKYLLEKERSDYRLKHGSQETDSRANTAPLVDIELSAARQHTEPCVILQNLTASWSVDKEAILKDLSLEIPSSKTTMVVGPVGSGKSSFLSLLLGEISEVSGTISTNFTHSAYCSQAPWITFGTIKENIVGTFAWNQAWYNQVIQSCALNTDFQQLPARDETKVGVRGSRLSGGQQMRVALARALYSREPVLVLDDALTGLDRETEKVVLESIFAQSGIIKNAHQTVIMATNSAHHLPYADHVIVLDSDGRVIEQGDYHDLLATQGYVTKISKNSKTVDTSGVTETQTTLNEDHLRELNLEEEQLEDASRRTGDLTVYQFYFQNIGWGLLSSWIGITALLVFGMSLSDVWLLLWTRANEQHPNQHVWFWIGGYAGVALFVFIVAFLAIWLLLMILQPKTAHRFHETLLKTTMRATNSFLVSTEVGNIINRFSQDLELIDEELPTALDYAIWAALNCISEGFFVFIGASSITVAFVPVCVLAVYFVATFYVKTSRQLRLISIETKAPLFAQFLEALGGLSSIRAYGWTDDYQRRTRIALDNSQRPFYLLFSIQRWLNLILDLMVASIAMIVVALALYLRKSSSMNLLAISLFNIVHFSGTLQALVKNWVRLETSIGAISRIRSYVQEAKTEDLDSETEDVAEDWPQKGRVEIYNLSASYESTSEPVLKEIDLKINCNEKIALCGRTGGGKSSLVSTLLRMLEPSCGSLFIDNVDISKISRSKVRSRINTIPQHPFFLHGSIRLNANPEGTASDDKIIESLQVVNLWTHIESQGGLDADWSDELLSHGQQQLFCLARAMCKSSNLLIMDEATSSFDHETETLMQSVIRDQFKNQTIIAIAHKLDSILDFDKVVVMEDGRIVEFDSPQTLLSKEGSAFKALYEAFHNKTKA